MQNDIKKAIEDIYINGDTELFISKCRDTVDFLDELLEKIKKMLRSFLIQTSLH